jgi:hypothetical protein
MGSGELGFREVAQFMEWMQPAVAAMENLDPLPPGPDQARNSVLHWIEAVRSLEERQRQSEQQARAQVEAVQARLDSPLGEIRKKESDLTRLSAELKDFSEWLHTTAA